MQCGRAKPAHWNDIPTLDPNEVKTWEDCVLSYMLPMGGWRSADRAIMLEEKRRREADECL